MLIDFGLRKSAFNVGQDTRTPLALIEYRYDTPFTFTGTLAQLTLQIEPRQLTPEAEHQGECRAEEAPGWTRRAGRGRPTGIDAVNGEVLGGRFAQYLL